MAVANSRRRDILVGLFVVVALAAGLVMVVLLGSEQGIFRPRFELRATFANVSGLRAGAPVFVAGLNVGSVRTLQFAPPAEEGEVAARVEVVLDVDARYNTQIRTDSVATVGSVGLLGDKSVEITVGSLSAAELGDGGQIRTAEPLGITEVLDELQPMARKLDQILGDIAIVTGDLANADSPLMQSMNSLSSILVKVDEGRGVAGRVVNSEEFADEFEALVEEANGLLAETTAAVSEVRRATEDLPATMASVRAVSSDVEELAIALRESAARFPAITEDIAITVSNLKSGSASVPAIAAGANRGVRRANEVVDAASRTIFLRGLVAEEKGAPPQTASMEFGLPDAGTLPASAPQEGGGAVPEELQ